MVNLVPIKDNPISVVIKDDWFHYFLTWLNSERWNEKIKNPVDKRNAIILVEKVEKALVKCNYEYAIKVYKVIFSGHGPNWKLHQEDSAKALWINTIENYPEWVHHKVIQPFIQETDFPTIKAYRDMVLKKTDYGILNRL